MTKRYAQLLGLRRAAVAAPGDQGSRIRRIDALIARFRRSPAYTGQRSAPLSPFMRWYCGDGMDVAAREKRVPKGNGYAVL